MPARALFPTLVYEARLAAAGEREFNRRLLHECLQYREDDAAGRAWSATRYPGGYTSYGSLSRMHTLSPTFAALERKLRRHVRAFARALEFDLEGRELAMTDCWINIMPRMVVHGLHLHPLSTISGTYYVRTPRGTPGIKFEDPRLDRFMAAPPAPSGLPAGAASLGYRAGDGRSLGAVRELAAPRGAAEPQGRRAGQRQLQLSLVRRRNAVVPVAPGAAPAETGE